MYACMYMCIYDTDIAPAKSILAKRNVVRLNSPLPYAFSA